jgi:hypothetical protein
MGQLARQAPAPLVRAEDVIDFRVRSLGHDREAAVTDQLAGRLGYGRKTAACSRRRLLCDSVPEG